MVEVRDIGCPYLVWYGLGRFVISCGQMSIVHYVSQALSLILVFVGVVLVLVNHKVNKYFLNKQ